MSEMALDSRRVQVRAVMTREVFTLSATHSLPLAESLMGLHRVRHIPVVDDAHRVVGLVTHRDILRAKLSELAPLTDDERSTIQLSVPVSRIMREEVWTIRPGATVVTAARLMRAHHFGCLPVTEDGVLVGIVTEADLLVLVTDPLASGLSPLRQPIANVMTGAPITITPTTSISDARALFERHPIHHLPVVENGRAVGMVSEREIGIAEAIFGASKTTPAAHVALLLGNGQLRVVRPAALLADVVEEMMREHRDAVLIAEDGVLAGIFTLVDACRLLAASG